MPDDMLNVETRLDLALTAMREPATVRHELPSHVAARAVLANAPVARARTWSLRAAAAITLVATGTAALTSARLLSRPAGVTAIPADAPAAVLATPTTQVVATSSRPIVFELDAPSARSVQVLGDFNQWSRSVMSSMQRGSDGRWRMTTMLPPGRYVYAFLVDGHTFRRDPQRDAIEDRDFGVTGSELVVGEAP